MPVTTIAEAVGSDVTNVVRSCVAEGRFGAAAHVLSAYLDSDVPVAVSDYTRQLIIASADDDRRPARHELRRPLPASGWPSPTRRSTPPTTSTWTRELRRRRADRARAAPGRLRAVPVPAGPRQGRRRPDRRVRRQRGAARTCSLVIAGNGPQARVPARALAAGSPAADRIVFLDDVDDDEKPLLMAGCAAFVLPSKPRPEFVETFGIALVEKMLAGGGPVITTDTGGIGEAVGDTALIVPVDSPASIAAALDLALTMPDDGADRDGRAGPRPRAAVRPDAGLRPAARPDASCTATRSCTWP